MTSQLVLEAGVALSWVLPDASAEQRQYATEVLKRVEHDQPRVVVPYIFSTEVLSVMLRAARLGVINQKAMNDGLARLESLPIEVHSPRPDLARFGRLGEDYGLPPHDALYLETAKELKVPIAAFDPSIRTSCKILGVPVYAL